MQFQPFLDTILAQMLPPGRAHHQAAMLRALLVALPPKLRLTDLVVGWQALALPHQATEPANVTHRRGICAELATLGASLTAEVGDLTQALAAWQTWQMACQASNDPRMRAMGPTFAREVAELQAAVLNEQV